MNCTNKKTISEAIEIIGNSIQKVNDKDNFLKEVETILENVSDENAKILKDNIDNLITNIGKLDPSLSENIFKNILTKIRFKRVFLDAAKSWVSLTEDTQDSVVSYFDNVQWDLFTIKSEFKDLDRGFNRILNIINHIIIDSTVFHIEYDKKNPNKIVSISSNLSDSKDIQNDNINKKLYAFKIHLLNTINKYFNIPIVDSYNLNDAQFTDMIFKALTYFESQEISESEKTGDTYRKAHDAYVLLKYFDYFIKESKIIDIKKAYSKTGLFSPNMYEYLGTKSKIASSWGEKEKIQDSSKINSPIFDLIFNHMPILNSSASGYEIKIARENVTDPLDISEHGNVVTSAAFMSVMSNFKKWLEATDRSNLILNFDEKGLLYALKSYLNACKNYIGAAVEYHSNPDLILSIYAVLKNNSLENGDFIINNLHPVIKSQIWRWLGSNEALTHRMYTEKNKALSGWDAKQKYVDIQEFKIKDKIISAVYEFSNFGKSRFLDIKKKYGIFFGNEVKESGSYVYLFAGKDGEFKINENTIRLRFESGDAENKLYIEYATSENGTFEFKGTIPVSNDDNDARTQYIDALNERIKPLIELLLGEVPEDWKDHLPLNTTANLANLFTPAMGVVLFAINNNSELQYNLFELANGTTTKILSYQNKVFANRLRTLAEMFADINGSMTAVTLKNLSGNSIPAFTLTSFIHSTKERIHLLTEAEDTVFEKNFIVTNKNKIGAPIIRSEYKIGDKIYSASDLSENSALYLGIMCDFFENLYKDNDKEKYIYFQNITNADKSTHHLIPYSKDIDISYIDENGDYYKKPLNTLLKDIVSENDSAKSSYKILCKYLFSCRQSEYRQLAKNLIEDFNKAFSWNMSTEDEDLWETIQTIRCYLTAYSSDEIKKKFKEHGVTYIDTIHDRIFNGSLLGEFKIYLNDYSNFEKKLNTNLLFFIKDLSDNGFEFNVENKEVRSFLNEISAEKRNKWIDSQSGNVALYLEDEINPLLKAYFIADLLCSTEYNIITTGFPWCHPGKYKPNVEDGDCLTKSGKYSTGNPTEIFEGYIYTETDDIINDPEIVELRWNKKDGFCRLNGKPEPNAIVPFSENYYTHDSAKRLAASLKRTVINGAAIERYVPAHYGIGNNFLFIEASDIEGTVWNMVGEEDTRLKTMDGCSYVHPIFAILCGWSSPSATGVTFDNKTIIGDLQARYGLPDLFKWAEYGITNVRRQFGRFSKASMEALYRKLSSIPLNQSIDLSKYYSVNFNKKLSLNKTSSIKTEPKVLYKCSLNGTKYYAITNIKCKPTDKIVNNQLRSCTICDYDLVECDIYGNPILINGQYNISHENREIDNIYDIDQILGGCDCMTIQDGKLQFSMDNQFIIASLICDEELKDKVIAYIVNTSAHKVGNRNVVGSEFFDTDYGIQEDGTYKSDPTIINSATTLNIGKQMNPDHELDFSEVSAMTQMISSLIQGGRATKLVQRIYIELGKLAAEKMKNVEKAISENNSEKIYQILGESLIKSFNTGDKSTTGLAQSFLLKASIALKENNLDYLIPFSAPTINGAFITDVISSINSKAIRQKFAGIADVLTPSNDTMQVFLYNGQHLSSESLAKKLLKEHPRIVDNPNETLLEKERNDIEHISKLTTPNEKNLQYATDNGVIEEYNSVRDIHIEDTIIVTKEKINNAGESYLTTEIVKIDSYEKYDYYRNCTDVKSVSKWTTAPRNLCQMNIYFTVEGIEYSIYDLDSVRVSYYIKDNELSIKQWMAVENILIRLGYNEEQRTYIQNNWKKERLKLKKAVQKLVSNDLKALDKKTKYLYYQTCFGENPNIISATNIKVTDVRYEAAEMIMGKLHGIELGLRTEDTISDIINGGVKFFEKRIKETHNITRAKPIYDFVVTTKSGKTVYIACRDTHNKKELNCYTTQNKNLIQNNEGIWDDGDLQITSYTSETCKISTIINDAKETCPLIIVDTMEDAKQILHGEGVDFSTSVTTEKNIKSIYKYIIPNNAKILIEKFPVYSKNGNILRYQSKQLTPDMIDEFETYTGEQQEAIISAINQYVYNKNEKQIQKLAKKRYFAFKQQLEYIGARIPTQSMQSFQALRVIAYINELNNRCYVPKIQTWLQGSDYDIDKLYLLAFALLQNGEMPTLSKLADILFENDNILSVLKLDTPNGKYYTELSTNINSLNEGDNRVFDDININVVTEGDIKRYTISSIYNPNQYIKIVGYGEKYILQDIIVNNIKEATSLFKAFVELTSQNAAFKAFDENEDSIQNQLLQIVSRSKYLKGNAARIYIKDSTDKYKYHIVVTNEDLNKVVSKEDFSIFNKIMESSGSVIEFEESDPSNALSRQYFLEYLNTHTQGIPVSINFIPDETSIEQPLQNEDLEKIINNDSQYIKSIIGEAIEPGHVINLNISENADKTLAKQAVEALRDYIESDIYKKIPHKDKALQNTIAAKILELLSKTSIQIYGHTPISLDDIKAIVNDTDSSEKRLSMDNPYYKFLMQIQNMVGKEVIGISAVSMKVFFAASTYFNEEIENAASEYIDGSDSNFTKHISNILFIDYTTKPASLNSMANLNFEPLEELLPEGGDMLLNLNDFEDRTDLKNILRNKYLVHGKVSLRTLLYGNTEVEGLVEKTQKQDAANNISQLLSAATDNAKELILSKINATVEFADIWGGLLMTGHSFEECHNLLQSPFFNSIAKFTKNFDRSKLHEGVSKNSVIKFMNFDGNIPSINTKHLYWLLGSLPYDEINDCFYLKLLYKTNDKGIFIDKEGKEVTGPDSEAIRKKLVKRTDAKFYRKTEEGLIDTTPININEEYIKLIEGKENSPLKNDRTVWFTNPENVKILIKHLRYLLKDSTVESALRNYKTYESSYDFDEYGNEEEENEDMYGYGDQEDEGPYYDDEEEEEGYREYTDIAQEGSVSDTRLILRYAQKFMLERAQLIENNLNEYEDFNILVKKIIPFTEEISITGTELGVNQGIPTDSYEFYSKLMKIENFINKKYIEAELVPDFNIIQFITDTNYRQAQIKAYESIKLVLNPLAIISEVPNFAKLFDYFGTAEKLLNRSAQFKLDFQIAKMLLNNATKQLGKESFNTKKLNDKEFQRLHNAIKDSLILNWIPTNNIKINLPQLALIYLHTEHGYKEFYNSSAQYQLELNSLESLATFKHLMDYYIIPKLKEVFPDNKFLKAIESNVKENKLHEQIDFKKRISINMMEKDESIKTQDLFYSIEQDFENIASNTEVLKQLGISDGELNIGDIFYLYNLYTYKDSFSQDSFTILFENINIQNPNSLVNLYYQWLSKIDRLLSYIPDINVSSEGTFIDNNLPVSYKLDISNDTIEFTTTDSDNQQYTFKINFKDLIYRIVQLKDSGKKFGYNVDYDKGVSQMYQIDSFGNPVENGASESVRCKNSSDFCMELPFSTSSTLTKEEIERLNLGIDPLQRFVPADASIINMVLNAIDAKCDEQFSEQIQFFDANTINEWMKQGENSPIPDITNKNMIKRICEARGFIYNGKIYLRKAEDNDYGFTKIHEFGHYICASLKFSKNEEERNYYYKLLSEVYKKYSKAELIQKAKQLHFKTITTSDFKEELLVDYIASILRENIKTAVNENEISSEKNMRSVIQNVINEIFDTNTEDDPNETDIQKEKRLQQIGNTDFRAFVARFGNFGKEIDRDVTQKVIMSAEMKAFKQLLLKTSQKDFDNSKEGIFYTC